MKTLRAMLVRFAGLFRRKQHEAEMSEELRAHLDALVERNVAGGMPPDEARFAALRTFGGVTQIAERARDERRSPWGDHLQQDLRYGLRQIRKHPGFSAIVMLILGLGVGANTAVFSALEVLLLRSLPVRDPEQLVIVTNVRTQGQAGAVTSAHLSTALFEALRDRAQSFAGVLTLNGSGGSRTLSRSDPGQATTVRVRTSDVSGSYFSTLQVTPLLGRLIVPDDDQKGAARPVAVLSHSFWQRQFGGDRGVVGRTVLIENVAFEIIGVTPAGFGGVRVGEPIDVFSPLWMIPTVNPRFGRNLASPTWSGLFVMGRLRPGVTREAAAAEIDLLYQQVMSAAQPAVAATDRARTWGRIELASGAGGYGSDARDKGGPILGILLVVVALVQVIACANVASLSLARLASRQRELAARTALGAGRGRIVRQLLTEALLLVAGGAVVGGLLVQWGFFAARARGIEVQPGGWILLFGLLVSALSGVIVALVPALKSSRIDLVSALKIGAGGALGGGRHVLQKLLVVVQIALSGCLLAGTGLFVLTLHNLQHVELGFRTENLLLAGVEPPRDYDAPRRLALVHELLDGFAALPGVEHVTVSVGGLLTGGEARWAVTVPGYVPERDEDMNVQFVFVGPDYFETVGLPLVSGRGFDRAGAFPSRSGIRKIVINEAVARRFFGDADPIGRQMNWGRGDRYEIAGVAKTTKYRSLRADAPLVCYIPYGEMGVANLAFQLRVAGDPRAVVSSVAAVIQRVDPKARALLADTIENVLRRATESERTVALGVGGFSVLALLLTVLGLYGMLAHQVAQRTKEIGVRMALGGRAGNIVALIVQQGLALTLVGWMAGVVAAMVLTRFIASRLYGVSAGDPIALLGSGILLGLVALLACWLPARRATKVDPMVALRAE